MAIEPSWAGKSLTTACFYKVMQPMEACTDPNNQLHTPQTCDILKLGFSA
jgi:hypothetical protein